MFFNTHIPIINKIEEHLFQSKKIEVLVKRDDLLHPILGGNKIRKLKGNISYALNNNIETLITFGGAYSNHIAATALAGKIYGLKTLGIIRGDELKKTSSLNNTLSGALQNGMELKFISRKEFYPSQRTSLVESLQKEYKNSMIIPEGGANQLANKGLSEIISEIGFHFDYLVCPVGTGSTLFGIAKSLSENQKIIGIDVLNRPSMETQALFIQLIGNPLYNAYGNDESSKQNSPLNKVILNRQFHFGGYAKKNTELVEFCQRVMTTHNMAIEPVYSGKMFYGLYELIRSGFFEPGTRILALHTGGLQYLSANFS